MAVRSLAVLVIPALAVAVLPIRPMVDVTALETARVRTHLATVEAELRTKDVSALTPAQRQARVRNLDVLHEYWVHAVFPVNTDFPGRRVPYFVDRYGTRCAMAYLIEQSGRGDLVARIAATHNNAYVHDLQDDPELSAWLRTNGLTAAEAAHIQPAYGSPYAEWRGRWEGKAVFGPGDSVVVRYVLMFIDSDDGWTLTFAKRDPVAIRVVTFGGDSLVAEAGPLANILKVRCITSTDVMLDRQASVVRVTYRGRGIFDVPEYASRIALRWRGRVGWILDDDIPVDSAPPGTFRAHPSDTLLVTPSFIRKMTERRLRLQWARTLLRDPEVPLFVPVGLIAALKDTVDEQLAALLVSAPSVTRHPELLAALAHLAVAPDSGYRRNDGGSTYVSASTGYANARDAADLLLWRQALTLIAAPSTTHDVLLTIATWNDRHLFMWCGADPRPLFAALRARATRERDTTVLAALARERPSC